MGNNPSSNNRGRLFKGHDESKSIQTAILKLERRVARLDPKLISEAQEKLKPLQRALDEMIATQSQSSNQQSTDDQVIQNL